MRGSHPEEQEAARVQRKGEGVGAEPRARVRGTGGEGGVRRRGILGRSPGRVPGGARRCLKLTCSARSSLNQLFGQGPCRPWLHSRSKLLVFDPT